MTAPVTHPQSRRRWLGLLLLASCASTELVRAQRYHTHRYREVHGLPSSSVQSMVQDRDGRMWFATRGGIASYDGFEWTRHALQRRSDSPRTSHVLLDSTGSIWAIDHGRLSRFTGGVWQLVTDVQLRADEEITSVTLLRRGQTDAVVIVVDEDDVRVWSGAEWRVPSFDGGTPRSVRGLASVAERCYLATTRGLYTLDADTTSARLCQLQLPGEDVRGVAHDSEFDALWTIGPDWVARFDAVARTGRTAPAYQRTGLAQAFRQVNQHWYCAGDRRGGMWMGGWLSGFHVRADGAIEVMSRRSGLATDGWNCVYVDREDNVWFGSSRGVDKIVSRRFANYDRDHDLYDDEVTAVLQRRSGEIVIGHRGGLTFWQEPTATLCVAEDGTRGRVMDLAESPTGELWLAAEYMGVAALDANRKLHWIDLELPAGAKTHSLHFDRRGRLWVASNNRVYRRSGADLEPIALPGLGFERFATRRLYEGSDGAMYFATSGHGLIAHTRSGPRHWTDVDPRFRSTYAVLDRGHGAIWVGTRAGLCRARGKRLELLTEPGPIVRRPVYALTETRAGHVWIGTDRGVLRWDGHSLRAYDTTTGMIGAEVNRAALTIDSANQLWIGTDRGLSIYRPQLDRRESTGPTVELLGLDADGSAHILDAPLTVASDTRTLGFRFRAISFVDEGRVRFRRWLEGYDAHWLVPEPLPTRRVQYTNLPAGEYRLHLQAIDVEGRLSGGVVSSAITIRAQLWLRPWFILACVGSVLALAAGFVAYRAQRRYSRRLERAVREQTDELRRMEREHAKAERLHSLGLFAGGIAHDFNNLLTAIGGSLSLVERDESLSDKTRRSLGNMQNSCARARSLTAQLLTFSRGGAPVRSPASIAKIIRESVDMVLDGAMITCQIDLPDDLYRVNIDAGQMSQVLNNLLINARQAMLHGGLIRIVGRNLSPAPPTMASERAVRIVISDEGSGISSEHRDRIFDPYFTTKPTGSGLGLATAHSIVDKHDGVLELVTDPEPVVGTSISIILPACVEDREVAKSQPVDGVANERILVMDDDPDVLNVVACTLEEFGYAVVRAGDGAEAIDRFREHHQRERPIDAVILDLKVPGGVGGLAALRGIRAIAPAARAIVTSGYSDDAVLADYTSHGFDGRLSKPFVPDELAGLLRHVLANGR